MAKVLTITSALTANGGSNGILTIANTAGYVQGATVYLNATGLPMVELEVAAVLSGTQLAVKLKTSASARYNSSGYTTALSSSITQPAQEVFGPATSELRGRATIQAGQSSVTVANSVCRSTSFVRAWIQQAADDTTLKVVRRTYAQDSQFAIVGDANATAAVAVAWEIVGG